MSTYNVTYKRDDGTWLVWVSDDDRLHSYGRTIPRARDAIREVIALWHDDEDAELVETFDLGDVDDAVADALRSRHSADEAAQRATEATRCAVRRLRERGVSVRDSAAILGLSHARVDQLAR